MYSRIRTALGLEEMPEGSVSFFKRLEDGEEEYHLRYSLSPEGKIGREERIIGQVDVGKVFILARRLPAEGDGNESTSDDLGRLTAEVDQSRELESGAKVTTETTWENGQLGPVELGAIEAFFVPAVDLLEREDE